MFKMPLLCSAALIASVAVGIAARAGAQESATPDFMSANFGWQPNTGFDFRPVAGKVAPVSSDPHPRRGNDNGQLAIERLSDAENPNLKPWAADNVRTAEAPME